MYHALNRHTAGEPTSQEWAEETAAQPGEWGYVDVDALERTLVEWEGIFESVRARLVDQDRVMVERHARRADLARHDARYIFAEGDQVLLRAREAGKSKARARGPYLFRRYVGWRQVNAEIVQLGHDEPITVSAANLLPMHPAT